MRQGVKLNEKLVVRFYKEDLDEIDGQMQVTSAHQPVSNVSSAGSLMAWSFLTSNQVYLVQVNAGGKWRDDDDIKLLISDIFSPFAVKARCNIGAFLVDVQAEIDVIFEFLVSGI